MKVLLFLAVIAVCRADLVSEWVSYKGQFNKEYTNGNEELHRMNIFFKNKRLVEEHNAKYLKGQVSYKMKVNHLADMESHEVAAMLNGYNGGTPMRRGGAPYVPTNAPLPDTVDWRTKNLVTPIKDQGQCGSCWAFSAVGSMEGQHAKKTKKLVSLSEQNLVDCSGKYGNEGCNGGWMDQAFEYVKDNNGIDTEDSYPYTGVDGTCKFNKNTVGATITGYVDIPTGDEGALKSAVATIGPISVAIDASSFSFQLYSGGVYTDNGCSTDMLDHGVLAVGYGTENGQDYWLVKNSWGATWGEEGYIKMARNKDNMCGIATKASYPTV